MKCLERLVMICIKTIIPPTLDPLQFAYWHNRSTADAISYVIHLALSHLEHMNTCFSSISIQHLILICHRHSSVSSSHSDLMPHSATGFWTSSLWQNSGSKDPREYITLSHSEHWSPSGLCSQPITVHTTHPWLHCSASEQSHHQVRWRYNSGGPYLT